MDKDYVDKLYIGTINLSQAPLDEVSVGRRSFPDGLGECKICVYGGEKNIPHFHIESTSSNFVCCVKIYEPYYFIHPGKEGTLNSAQREELDKYLRTKYKPAIGKSNETIWERIADYWNNANPTYAVNRPNATQPDYNKLTDEKPPKDKKKGLKEDSTWLVNSFED